MLSIHQNNYTKNSQHFFKAGVVTGMNKQKSGAYLCLATLALGEGALAVTVHAHGVQLDDALRQRH